MPLGSQAPESADMNNDDFRHAVLVGRMEVLRDATNATLGFLAETRAELIGHEDGLESFSSALLGWLQQETRLAITELRDQSKTATPH